jgi:putative membrane protein
MSRTINEGPSLAHENGEPIPLEPGPQSHPEAIEANSVDEEEGPTAIILTGKDLIKGSDPEKKRREGRYSPIRSVSMIAIGFAAILASVFVFEIVDLLLRMFALGPWFGFFCAAGISAGAVLVGFGIHREIAGVRRLKSAARLRRCLKDDDEEKLEDAIAEACAWAEARGIRATEIDNLRQAESKGAVRKELRNNLAERLSEEVNSRIKIAVVRIAGIATASPSKTIDTFAFLLISTKLARDIATVYGMKPSFTASILLVKQALFDSTILMSTEIAADLALKLVGNGGLVGRFLAEAAGAAVSANRMAALGTRIQRACNPIREDVV